MFVPSKRLLLGSALLLAAVPILRADESVSSIAPPASRAPHAAVNCPGITGVPMTADAEQSLPLQTVGSLSCGENVTILSDSEGYTTRIRTDAGEEGYVARMYLVNEAKTPLAPKPVATAAFPTHGVVRWQAGAPGCEQFTSDGRHVESVTANGVTVQISLQDTGWKFRASVAVSNHGASTVEVLPSLVSLDELKPGLRPLLQESPNKLQHVPNHQVFRTAANARPSPSAVALRADQMPAASSLVYRSSANAEALTRSSYRDPSSKPVSSAPDSAEAVALSLKPASLPAGGETTGVVWFARDADARELTLRVVVGELVFDFPFSFGQSR